METARPSVPSLASGIPATIRPHGLVIGCLAALATAMPFAVRADSDGDQDRARELYEHGEIHALDDILRIVEARDPGDVVSVDLLRLADKWVYRFQIIASDGRRSAVDVDAGAGSVISEAGGGP
jgi:uncharacterized membrane protein YkoI